MRSHKPPKDSFEYLTKRDTKPSGFKMLDRWEAQWDKDPEKVIEWDWKESEKRLGKLDVSERMGQFRNMLAIASMNMTRKRKPTNIVLDKSVLEYINESTFDVDGIISLPDFEKNCVWVNVKDFGFKIQNLKRRVVDGVIENIEPSEGEIPEEKLIVGITFVNEQKFLKDVLIPNYKKYVGEDLCFKAFSVLQPPYSYFIVHLENMDLWRGDCITRPTPHNTFDEMNKFLEDRKDKGDYRVVAPLYECVFKTLIALNMIKEGKFNVKSKIFEDRNVKWSSQKSKKAKRKGLKFKQKYRQYKTSYYSIDPSQQKERSTYTPPEHYTPRNIPSHFKERWVTIDYVEKHNVPDEDILDIEDRTKLYKNGVATKAWVKIKLWFEFTQDPNLAPKQEIERYRV